MYWRSNSATVSPFFTIAPGLTRSWRIVPKSPPPEPRLLPPGLPPLNRLPDVEPSPWSPNVADAAAALAVEDRLPLLTRLVAARIAPDELRTPATLELPPLSPPMLEEPESLEFDRPAFDWTASPDRHPPAARKTPAPAQLRRRDLRKVLRPRRPREPDRALYRPASDHRCPDLHSRDGARRLLRLRLRLAPVLPPGDDQSYENNNDKPPETSALTLRFRRHRPRNSLRPDTALPSGHKPLSG
jgi:hypothetical protein